MDISKGISKLKPEIFYKVDLTNHSDDLFHVTVDVENLSSENNIYNFPATTPGMYNVVDFGRFVKTFKALDDEGKELKVQKISTNKWQWSDSALKLVS